ncbi:MAG TPA: M20/M25/M40 family metallo-hydrolase, partial [candidate division Zixibacteria bacterium]|nr:M20/M25/M40 family metallo-hydrolase [candidate division Zixibacteria bacterium]
DGKRALGPAVADMKGGLVVMVDALRQLGSRAAPEIVIVLSRDEQAGSLRSGATIEALGRTATWCLCFECGRDGDRVMTSRARVGVGRAVARVEGGYAGTAVNAAENASIVLGRALVVLGGVHDDRYRVTPTILRAGVRRSVIPSVGQAVLDVRARDDAAWAAMIARLEAVPAEIDQIGHLTFEAVAHRPALPRTPLTEAFLAFVRNVGTELGIHLAETGSFAAGSSAFIDSSRVAVLDGMGPAGGDLMTDREYIEVGSIGIRSALVAETTAHLAYWSGAAGH